MGCGNSKQKLCRNCKLSSSSYPPLLRSYSMQSSVAGAAGDNNNHHSVVLSSSSILSHPLTVKLDLLDHKHHEIESATTTPLKKIEEIAIGEINDEPTKIRSKWMDEKVKKIVPKTPTKTPTGKPEIIDAWELMEGLNSPVTTLKPPFHNYTRSFSFHFSSYQPLDHDLTHTIDKNLPSLDGNDQLVAPAEARRQEFPDTAVPASVDDSEKLLQGNVGGNKPPATPAKEKLIMYFTSLRGVRKTYDDCCDVRNIFKQLGVKVDERDVSMHSVFKTELKDLSHDHGYSNEGSIVLPKVFIGKRLIGGAEEIRRMHEEGELRKTMEGVALAADGGCGGGVCEVCGDARFVPCGMCFGSCKVYYEGDYDNKSLISGFKRCNDCNENGLVRCPICTSL